jgi:hypothetical protein
MTRLALVVGLLAVCASCKEHNPASCEIAENMGKGECPDAAVSGGSCKADDSCTDKSNFPACDTAVNGGTCFKCTAVSHALCTGETPHCDSHECVACVDNNDCDDGAGVCLPSGGCAAASSIIHATPTGPITSCGIASNPCSLDGALVLAKAGPKVIKLDDAGPYVSATNYTVDVDAAIAVTIDARNATIRRNSGGAIFTINDGKGMTILGGTIENATGGGGDGIRCSTNATLGVYGTTIQANAESGIDASGCAVTLVRSKILSNQGGGLSVMNGKFVMVGNVFLRNGNGGTANSAVTISTSLDDKNRLEFNTIANNMAQTGVAGVDCKAGVGFTAHNNIIWNNTGTFQINGNCLHSYSDIGPLAVVVPGTGNRNDDPLLTADGHIGTGSPATQKVEIGADLSDLASRDIDGDRRIAPADLGADQVPRP